MCFIGITLSVLMILLYHKEFKMQEKMRTVADPH